jgi:hypothetical protein
MGIRIESVVRRRSAALWTLTLSLLPAAGSGEGDQGVAVCVTGIPRTLFRPHVYESFNKHVVSSIAAEGWRPEVFLVPSVDLADTARMAEVRTLALRTLNSLVKVSFVSTEPLRPRLRCTMPLLVLPMREQLDSFKTLQQWVGMEHCYDEIGRAEQSRGEAYRWIVRVRTDAVFYRSVSLAALNETGVYVPLGGMSATHHMRCMNDHMFVCPRALCRPYFKLIELFVHAACRNSSSPDTRVHVPTGLLAPPTEPFVLPRQVRIARQRIRTAQWWFASRYGAKEWCRTPDVYTVPGQEVPCCGSLREYPWIYSLSRAPSKTALDIHAQCVHLNCARVNHFWHPRSSVVYPRGERSAVTKECAMREKEHCLPDPGQQTLSAGGVAANGSTRTALVAASARP